MGVPDFIFGVVVCLLIQLSTGQMLINEELRNEASCTLDVTISCGNNDIIAVHSVYFFYDSDCTNTCCKYNSSHSSVGADENDIQGIRRLCSGRESCSHAFDGKRNFGQWNVQTPSYVMVQYFCIPGSRMNTVCSNEEIMSQGRLPLYLTNENYPSVTTGNSTCSCSLEINSCSSNVRLHLLDIDLYLDTKTCEQSLEFVNGKGNLLKDIHCESYHTNNLTTINLGSHYVRINFVDNSTQNQEGYFLLGFEASDANALVSLSCTYKQESICRDCEDNANVSNGSLNLHNVSNTGTGALADVECNPGYETKKTTVICEETGRWENSTCFPKDCGNVPRITNGLVTLVDTQNTKYGALANVSCSEGFESDSNNVTCLESGQWSQILCTSKDCGSIARLDNGQITLASANMTRVGAIANVACNIGYNASALSIRCLRSGQWETERCTIIDDDRLTSFVLVSILSTLLIVVMILFGFYVFWRYRKRQRKRGSSREVNTYEEVYRQSQQPQYSDIALETTRVDE